jgi:pyridinium-3,5-biscarboxylic acid mononucleotide synthase
VDQERLRNLLVDIRDRQVTIEDGLKRIKALPYENLGFATVDHHRSLRQGVPEIVFGEGKAADQILGIVESIIAQEENVLITRLSADKAEFLLNCFSNAEYHPRSRVMTLAAREIPVEGRGIISVISAGTSDLPVAEEALVTARFLGNRAELLQDMGVAGVHRILAHREVLEEAAVFIVVAGMEGALPSVVGGLVNRPVIAVPTSIGYGASFMGLAALLGMLNSCASNVTVVNIDNGFGAAYVASLINRM